MVGREKQDCGRCRNVSAVLGFHKFENRREGFFYRFGQELSEY